MEKTPRSDHQPPALVLYLLTDPQALWTVSGIYRLARRGGEASLSATADFGWREPPVATPHHDRLLREGAFFANFHVSGLWCVPSRGVTVSLLIVSLVAILPVLGGQAAAGAGRAAIGARSSTPRAQTHPCAKCLHDRGAQR